MSFRFDRERPGKFIIALAVVVFVVLAACSNPTGGSDAEPDAEPDPDPVANPAFSPGAGLLAPPVSVTISSATAGASIRYTLDGTMPTATDGIEYSGQVPLSRSGTISAIAYKDGLPDSDVVTAVYALPKVYVARTSDGEVTVIAGATGAILTTITVGSNPVGIAANPNTGLVYIANSGDNSITVVDSATDTVTATITSIPGARQLAVNAVTNTVYATANESGLVDSVYPIDGSNGVAGTAISVGENPDGIAVNTATNRVYVSHASSEDVYVIDGATKEVVGSPIGVGSQPEGVAVNESSNTIYVANSNDNTLEIISGTTSTSTGQVALGGEGAPWGIAINQNTGIVCVAATDFPGTIRVVETSTNAETASVSVGNNPYYVAIDQSQNRIYVTSYDANEVAVIDGTTNTVADTIDLSPGAEPEGIDVLP